MSGVDGGGSETLWASAPRAAHALGGNLSIPADFAFPFVAVLEPAGHTAEIHTITRAAQAWPGLFTRVSTASVEESPVARRAP